MDLFVELVVRTQDHKFISSEQLIQRYIDEIILGDPSLGKPALLALEEIAFEMLNQRSLYISKTKFSNLGIINKLERINILYLTDKGLISFGHQTLIDVFVINNAISRGETLFSFITSLPPVPFIRPFIRKFLNRLYFEDQKAFRKQIRKVLTSNIAFHIRRLAASTIAEHLPSSDYWPMIFDTFKKNKEIFQVIYLNANKVEWFDYWDENLVPLLQADNDHKALVAHAHRISIWKNERPKEIIGFWINILEIVEKDNPLIFSLESYLAGMNKAYSSLILPLLNKLISLAGDKHFNLGNIVVNCVLSGTVDDSYLINFICKDLSNSEITSHNLSNYLHCGSHEFGQDNKDFLLNHMKNSEQFLNLVIEKIEQWNTVRNEKWRIKGFHKLGSFLSSTSFENIHSKSDLHHSDSLKELLNAVEQSILNQAERNSLWWIQNKKNLGESNELALRYFSILACSAYPENNTDLIFQLLIDYDLLLSCLVYEIGELINKGFVFLTFEQQEIISDSLLSILIKNINDDETKWKYYRAAKYTKCIPGYKRVQSINKYLDLVEKERGPLTLTPEIHSESGIVRSPFSYKMFLKLDNNHIVYILEYYKDFKRNISSDLIGGKDMVGRELRRAASYAPNRFFSLLIKQQSEIIDLFKGEIVEGISDYIECVYGNLQKPENWNPIEIQNISDFVESLLNFLDRYPNSLDKSHSKANLIKACSLIVSNSYGAFKLAFHIVGFTNLIEENSVSLSTNDLLTAGINSKKGIVAEATIILCNRLIELNESIPEILLVALSKLIKDDNPAIRAVILHRFHYFLFNKPEQGWLLLDHILQKSVGLWEISYNCLYYTYQNYFLHVNKILNYIYKNGNDSDLKTWAMISSLSVLSGYIKFDVFLKSLIKIDNKNAWEGAGKVWTNSINLKNNREMCIKGITIGLQIKNAKNIITEELNIIFNQSSFIILPKEVINLYLSSFLDNEDKNKSFHGFDKWLNRLSQYDPLTALEALDLFIDNILSRNSYYYDSDNNLPQILTRVFAEAEEKEESDNGEMLIKVISCQDKLLQLGISEIENWLKDAERP